MQLGQVLLQPGSSLPWQSEQVLTFLVNNLNHTMQEMPLWNQLKNLRRAMFGKAPLYLRTKKTWNILPEERSP